jgi:hypothetical protein
MFWMLFIGEQNRGVRYIWEKPETTSLDLRYSCEYFILISCALCINVNTVLILIRPCATNSKSARFYMFLLSALFHTMFRPKTYHHQVYKVCLRSLLCFPFDQTLRDVSFRKSIQYHPYKKQYSLMNITDKSNTSLDTKAWLT